MVGHDDQSSQYWKDFATILVRMKRFQFEIERFRKANDIPEDGILPEDRANWYQSFHATPDFSASGKHGSGSDYELLPPNESFIDSLAELALKFNLDSRWYQSLFMYVCSGGELAPPYSEGVKVLARVNDVRLPKEKLYVTRLMLEIRKDTTVSDIRKVWSQIKAYQEYMSGEVPAKRRPIQPETIERYLKIRDLEDNEVPQRVIAEKLDFLSAKEVADFKQEVEQRFSPTYGAYRNVKPLWWHKK